MQKNIYEEDEKCIIVYNLNKFTEHIEFFNLAQNIIIKENNFLHLFNKNSNRVEQSISMDGSYIHIENYRNKLYFLYGDSVKIFDENSKEFFSEKIIEKNFYDKIVSFVIIDYIFYFATEAGIIYNSDYENIILQIPLKITPEPENFYFENTKDITAVKISGKKCFLIQYQSGAEFYRLALNNKLEFLFYLRDKISKVNFADGKIFILGSKLHLIDDFISPKIIFENYIAALSNNTFISDNHINIVENIHYMGKYPMEVKSGDIKINIEKLFDKLNRFRNSVLGSTSADEVKNLYLFYLKEIFDILDAKEKVNYIKASLVLEQSERLIQRVMEVNKRQRELINKFNFFIKKNKITAENKNFVFDGKDRKSLAILKEQNEILKSFIRKILF